MARASEPPLASLLTAVVRSSLRDLAHWSWRPHRVFDEKPEPLVLYHDRLAKLYEASQYAKSETLSDLMVEVVACSIEVAGRRPLWPVCKGLAVLLNQLVRDNNLVCAFPALDRSLLNNSAYAVPLRRSLNNLEPYLVHETGLRELFLDRVCAIATGVIGDHLPPAAFGDPDYASAAKPSLFTVPLISLMANARAFVMAVTEIVFHDGDGDADPAMTLVLAATRHQVSLNILAASGLTPDQAAANPTKIIGPQASELQGVDLVEAYLAHTPFAAFAKLPVPFSIPMATRFEHCHIVAGTGHGKTQLMQAMILADLDDPARPSIVTIDGQGAMIRDLGRLRRFDPDLDDRLIIIDPADSEWPLRLNLFDVNRSRIDKLSLGAREQILAGVIELYDYIFGALLGAELTAKQSVVFRFLAQLMMAIPNATIHTLRQLLEDPNPFAVYVEKLPPTTRAFLTDHLFNGKDKQYSETRRQILRRLFHVLSNPTFDRLFSHPKNALDMKVALDSGKVIIINTAKDVLKDEWSAIFGRYMIALLLQAAFERAAQPANQRHPAFVYIDEASDYFDRNIDSLLIQARQFKVGLTFAHQSIGQLKDPGLRASVMTNPAVRFAGGLSALDANALDSDMRTSNAFLMATGKRRAETDFACYVRNLTPTAVRLCVPLGAASREPLMSNSAHDKLMTRIRAAVAAPLDESIGAAPAGTPSPLPKEPDSFSDSY